MTTMRIVAVSMLIALAGCQNPMPSVPATAPTPAQAGYGTPPAPTASTSGTAGATQRFLTEMDVPGDWWTLFHSPELNALIDRALSANPDIDAAQASLRVARETLAAQRAAAYPNAQGSFSVSRQQLPTYYAPPLSTNTSYVYGVHTASLDVAYTPDVFGNVRYQTLSAAAAAEQQRYQVEATYLTLTSNVVTTAVTIAGLRAQIDDTQRIIATDTALLELVRAQRSFAQAAGLDVLVAETQLRAAEQTLPALQKQLAQSLDLIARLVGVGPDAIPPAAFDLAALHLPEDLPLSLPLKLVAQRPDIAAASANLAQASADVGVAYTNRLPNFAITSQTATQALSFATLFGPGTLLSTLTGEIATTFYDHGQLKHRENAAIASYGQAAAQYKGAVLSGFENVADALAALHTDADGLRTAVRSAESADHALRITRAQHDLGAISNVNVLIAEQTAEQAELAVAQNSANRYADTAALFAALGGGWWNRSDVPAH